MRNSPASIIFIIALGLLVVGLTVWLTAPATVVFGGATYVVPRKAQFVPDLRSKGEIDLMLRGMELATHIPGFHATLPTVDSNNAFVTDTPVQFTDGDGFDSRQQWPKKSLEVAPPSPEDATLLKALQGQQELRPGCTRIEGQKRTYRSCIFTYLDGGLTVQFWLEGDNIPFAPEVARYAVQSLERYRKP